MANDLNSRRGLRTPLANAARRREAAAVEDQGTPSGMSEAEVLRETASYNRVPGMRRAFQGPNDEPRIPDRRLSTEWNLGDYTAERRARGTPMKKGGPVKTKPPSRTKVVAPKKATRPAGRSSKPSRSR